MVHCTHNLPPSTLPRFLGRFSARLFVPAAPPPPAPQTGGAGIHTELQDSCELCTCVINQSDHISLAYKALFIARTDDTIDLILPRWAVRHYQCVYQTSLRVTPGPTHSQHLTPSKRHPRASTSASDMQCNPTPHPRATVSPIHRQRGSDTVLFQKDLLRRGCNFNPPPHTPLFEILTPVTRTARNSRHESVSLLVPNRCWLSINQTPPFCLGEQKKKKSPVSVVGLVIIPVPHVVFCLWAGSRLPSPASLRPLQ